ncbi:MAG: hypothetical protein M3Y64_01195, partial [Gemmatimonadota bacterium]|nr:hypothetical protein [Gemmatimonadota bacterium]
MHSKLGMAMVLTAALLACNHALAKPAAPIEGTRSHTSTVSYLGDALDFNHALSEEQKDILESARDSVTLCVMPDDGSHRDKSTCRPCSHPMAASVRGAALSNARDIWAMRGSSPYDNNMKEGFISCVWRSYEQAIKYSPQDPTIQAEYATIRLLSSSAETRAVALENIDHIVDTLLTSGETTLAVGIVTNTARMLWITAQHMLERPENVKVFDVEARAHDLAHAAVRLRRLPSVSAPSARLGVSEATWISALYVFALRLAPTNRALQASLSRNALTPFVTMADWTSVDRTVALLRDVPAADSVLRVATALSAHHRSGHTNAEAQSVMAKFDDALSHMPRADSARYDSFDGLLAVNDDEWRYEHLPDVLATLDMRGWALFDPLWSTPVNEMRLAHRARTAEADFLYAVGSPRGTAGSETPAGIMFMKRGAPSAHWTLQPPDYRTIGQPREFVLYHPALIRGWSGFVRGIQLTNGVRDAEVLYLDALSLQTLAQG